MQFPKKLLQSLSKTSLALATILVTAPQDLEAQLGIPSSNGRQWRLLPATSDEFNDNNLGWQWKNTAPAYFLHERSNNPKRGGISWSKFRQDNVTFSNGQLVIQNKYHYTPQKSGIYSNRYKQVVDTYTYSGGWMESKAGWLVEGQFQMHSRIDRNFADIWPTFWLNFSKGGAGGHELDIFQYQLNILDHSHLTWRPNGGGRINLSQRSWTPFGANPTPKWEHNWAMARVRNWSYWACRTTRNSKPTFYINGKLEHTSTISGSNSNKSMIFSSSPHINWRPFPTPDIPSFRVNWVRTHIP